VSVFLKSAEVPEGIYEGVAILRATGHLSRLVAVGVTAPSLDKIGGRSILVLRIFHRLRLLRKLLAGAWSLRGMRATVVAGSW
jgi:hypothetical protein